MIMFDVLRKFKLLPDVESVEKYGRGTVNRSYLVYTVSNRYLLLMTMAKALENPKDSLENIAKIISFMQKKQYRFPYEIVESSDGEQVVKEKDYYFRCYLLKPEQTIFKKAINDKMMFELGNCVGNFHRILVDLEPDTLKTVIPNCHDTAAYFSRLEKIEEKSLSDRVINTFNEYKFLENRKFDFKLLTNLLENKQVPLRVVHNNLRLNNMLFDENYNSQGIVGMDIIMPGTLLYDFGDAARYFCLTTREDETNLNLVGLHLDRFRLFVKGYFEEALPILTENEIEHLADSVRIMAIEYGIRHLTDYLENDTEFYIEYKQQNLDIAQCQLKLVQDIEMHYQDIKKIIRTECGK